MTTTTPPIIPAPAGPASAQPPPLLARLLRRQETVLFLCLVLVIAFFSFAVENFFSARNLGNVLGQASLALVAGIGCAIVFISGEVDISIGALLATVALPLILIMNGTGSLALGIGGALLLGLLIGSLNAFLSACAGINSLIVTLGTMFMLRGGVYLYTGQRAIPDERSLESFIMLSDGRLFGLIPYSAVIALVLLCAFAYVMRYRSFGRHIYAVGGNAEVARLAGHDVRRVKFTCFIISALLATVAGIILAARVGSAQHTAGLNFEFQVVAATVLGGVSLAGGIGSLGGMALGVLILQFLSNGLRGLGLPTEWQLIVTGMIIIAAVAFDAAKSQRSTRSLA
ncbi:ABC transporter permease [Verminephrobacter aporrectodeae]|uniref:ABC transporter permease n=1 Tax=Verminephrobacter aporrectodeae TaxID=1110389 RepID=UPI0002375104|nr:ABC transporter permease [Verminephrobacter aporrectodeae]